MALAKRLETVIPARSNKGGCRTCIWLKTLSEADRRAWYQWIADGKSVAQLFEIAAADPDNPFPVSMTALRHHVRNHHES